MEARLLQRSSLAEAGVDGEALLEGAATGTSLSVPYCQYLVSVLMEATVTAADPAIDHPQLNDYTVFCDTWHAASLARLSDADLANAWRLAEYLLLSADCFRCLDEVTAQRRIRSAGVVNHRLVPTTNASLLAGAVAIRWAAFQSR
jgi:hypothetical protein